MLLILVWLVIGVLVGLLAYGARLRPLSWGSRGWLAMIGIGVASALIGGWLGALLFGVQYATLTALWVGVVGVALPWFFTHRMNGTRPGSVGTREDERRMWGPCACPRRE